MELGYEKNAMKIGLAVLAIVVASLTVLYTTDGTRLVIIYLSVFIGITFRTIEPYLYKTSRAKIPPKFDTDYIITALCAFSIAVWKTATIAVVLPHGVVFNIMIVATGFIFAVGWNSIFNRIKKRLTDKIPGLEDGKKFTVLASNYVYKALKWLGLPDEWAEDVKKIVMETLKDFIGENEAEAEEAA